MQPQNEAENLPFLAMPVVLVGGVCEMTTKPKRKLYQGYSAHATDAEARAAFMAKFGRQPEEIRRTGGGVNAGPLLPEE